MGGAPYKSDKEGGGHSFDCFCVQPRKSAHVMLQQLEALKADNWTQNKVEQNHQLPTKLAPGWALI